MCHEETVKGCIQFFKTEKGFLRVLKAMKKKYESLGSIGGTVKIENITDEEKEALSGLFSKDYSSNKSVTVSLKKFEEALNNTKYSGISLLDVLEGCFGEIITKKKHMAHQKRQWVLYYEKLISTVNNESLKLWLDNQHKYNTQGCKWLKRKYKENAGLLACQIKLLDKITSSLPYLKGNIEHLSIFAASITGNPHGLDEDKDLHRLLIYYLINCFDSANILNSEEKIGLLYKVGLIHDSVSNFTACYGLKGYINGKLHDGWEGFYKACEPVNITLWNIGHVDKIAARNNTVFLVENPSVFSSITKKVKNISIICTNGQLRYSTYLILDKLAKEDTSMWYSGDFDPEGLLIADRLVKRYGNKLILWGYSEANYLKSMSDIKLTDSRLKQLDNIYSEKLCKIAQIIKTERKAGYQELIIDELINESGVRG